MSTIVDVRRLKVKGRNGMYKIQKVKGCDRPVSSALNRSHDSTRHTEVKFFLWTLFTVSHSMQYYILEAEPASKTK